MGSEYEVADFGARQFNPLDDYPDFIIPLAWRSPLERLSASCAFGSGVGVSIAANKSVCVQSHP